MDRSQQRRTTERGTAEWAFGKGGVGRRFTAVPAVPRSPKGPKVAIYQAKDMRSGRKQGGTSSGSNGSETTKETTMEGVGCFGHYMGIQAVECKGDELGRLTKVRTRAGGGGMGGGWQRQRADGRRRERKPRERR